MKIVRRSRSCAADSSSCGVALSALAALVGVLSRSSGTIGPGGSEGGVHMVMLDSVTIVSLFKLKESRAKPRRCS